MTTQTFVFYPFVRKDPRTPKEFGYVNIRITVDSIPREYSTKEKWSRKRWDKIRDRASGNKEDAQKLNALIDTLQSKATEAKNRMIAENRRFTSLDIIIFLQGKSDDRKFYLVLLKEHNEKMAEMVDIVDGYAKGTHRKFEDTYNHAETFNKLEYKRDDLELRVHISTIVAHLFRCKVAAKPLAG